MDPTSDAHRHVRLLLVMALWRLMLTGTIWPGSHGDRQSHQLMDLTAGQLRKGICPWELEAGGWREALCGKAAGEWGSYTQTDGGPGTRNLIPDFLSDHLEGHPSLRKCSLNSQIYRHQRKQTEEPPSPHVPCLRSEEGLLGSRRSADASCFSRRCYRQGYAQKVL